MMKRGEETRLQMLAVLRESGRPLSAYDLLAVLREENPKVAPTTVYRALEALMCQGRVHRLESLSAYIACQCGSHEHDAILSICGDCGSVQEHIEPDFHDMLAGLIRKSGFQPMRQVIEVQGVCGGCTAAESAA
jgi:Fur family zinc uptake transcriptional regulator